MPGTERHSRVRTERAPVEYVANRHRARASHPFDTGFLAPDAAERVRAFHRSLPGYAATPLVRLDAQAQRLGLAGLWLKDESARFGLDAFKVLGAAYAVARALAERLHLAGRLDFERLRAAVRDVGALTLVTATDGNHGRALAWAARALGQRAVVYLPNGATAHRLQAIAELGAQAEVHSGNYDDAVRHAARLAAERGWVLVQDTAWAGYEQVPRWIMQGYLTMFAEAFEQLGDRSPTHVFIQAGVGSLAGSLQGYLRERYGANGAALYVVEPQAAACYCDSARARDGKARAVTGALATIMTGLAAGEPSTLGWPILRDYAAGFFACADAVAQQGVRLLARPLDADPGVVSGESGAVTAGLVAMLRVRTEMRSITDAIGLGPESRVLLFSTEGATDPEGYARIMRMVDETGAAPVSVTDTGELGFRVP